MLLSKEFFCFIVCSMKMFSQYKGLPRQMYYLSAVKLIVEIAVSFVFPFVALICTERLGFNAVQAAYIVSITSIGNMIGALLGGKLADEWGRRKTYIRFAIAMITCMILAGFVCTHRILLVLIFISNLITSAVIPICSAMVVDLSPEDKRNECFSLMYIFSNIGTAVGPLMAGLLFYRHMPVTFFCVAGFYTLSLLIMVFLIKETYTGHRTDPVIEEGSGKKAESLFAMVFRHPRVLVFIGCMLFVFMSYMETSYVLPLQFTEAMGLDIGSKITSAIWSVNGVVVIVLTPTLMLFIKKHRPLFNLVIGCLLYALGFGLYALPINPILALVAVAVWTSGEIFVNNQATVYLAEISPETHRGRVASLYSFTRALGKLIGPLISSYILLGFGYSSFWIFIGILLVVISGVLFLLHRLEPEKSSELSA